MVVCLINPAKDLNTNSNPLYTIVTRIACLKANPPSIAGSWKLYLRIRENINVIATPPPSNPNTTHLGSECRMKIDRAAWRGFSIQLRSDILIILGFCFLQVGLKLKVNFTKLYDISGPEFGSFDKP